MFYTWTRIIKEHLPFYRDHETPLEFNKILIKQVFGSMGKLIFYTKGFKQRVEKFKEIIIDIKPLSLPFLLQSYLWLIILFPLSYIHKFYLYYLVPFCMKKYLKKI